MGNKPRIGEMLKAKGLLTSKQLDFLVELQQTQTTPIRFGALARQEGFVDEHTLTVLLGAQHGVPIVLHLERLEIDPDAVEAVPRALAERFLIIPLSIYDSGHLVVATTDPANEMVFRALQQHTNYKIKVAIASETDILEALDRVYDRGELWARPEAIIQDEEDEQVLFARARAEVAAAQAEASVQEEVFEESIPDDSDASWAPYPSDPQTGMSSFGVIDDVFAQILENTNDFGSAT